MEDPHRRAWRERNIEQFKKRIGSPDPEKILKYLGIIAHCAGDQCYCEKVYDQDIVCLDCTVRIYIEEIRTFICRKSPDKD